MNGNSPHVTVRITAAEREELHALAQRAGVSLSDALRIGGRLYLEARLAEPHRPGAKLSAAYEARQGTVE
jgi:hypothetical protein